MKITKGDDEMDKDLKLMTNALMEEMGRMEERINKRFDKVEQC